MTSEAHEAAILTDLERACLAMAAWQLRCSHIESVARSLVNGARPMGKSGLQECVLTADLDRLEALIDEPQPELPPLS